MAPPAAKRLAERPPEAAKLAAAARAEGLERLVHLLEVEMTHTSTALASDLFRYDVPGDASEAYIVLDSLPNAIAVLDFSGTIVFVNREWHRLAEANALGEPDDGVGSNYLALCDRAVACPEALQVAAGVRAVLRGRRTSFALDYACHSPTAQRWFRMSVTPLDSTMLDGALVTHVDVTESRRGTDARLELAAIVESAVDAIIAARADGAITSWNAAAERLFGWRSEEVIGRSIAMLLPVDRGDDYAGVVEGFQRGERSREWETVRLRKDGSAVEVHSILSPSGDADGEVTGVSAFVRDLTQVRRTIEERDRFFDMTSDLVCITTLDGRLQSVNPAWETMLGYSPADLDDRSLLDLVHPADRDATSRNAHMVMSRRTTGVFQNRMRTRTGEWRWIEWSCFASRNQPVSYCVGRDVSGQRVREEEAQVSEALAHVGEALIASVHTPVVLDRLCQAATEVLGMDYAVTWRWEPRAEIWQAVSQHGVPHETWDALRLVRLPPAMVAPIHERLERDDVIVLRGPFLADPLLCGLMEGDEVRCGVGIALRNAEGLVGMLEAGTHRQVDFGSTQMHVAQDVGHLASMALNNAQLLAEVQHASRLKSEFVSTMSHELRTPLNVILGYTEMLQDGGDAEEHGLALAGIRRSSMELLDMVESTLDLGSMAARRNDAHLELVHVDELLDELATEFERLRRPADVPVRWSPAPDVVVCTDRRKLKTIVKNLVANALKFTTEGEVQVAVRQSGTAWHLQVSDTGIGIAPEDIPVIFDMYRQVDGSETRAHGGVGLGLYIVSRLLEQLGGRIDVESTLGRGSRFCVKLPVDPGPVPNG